MNGKIDKDGFLHIERAGVIKLQTCPFTDAMTAIKNPYDPTDTISLPCGDWCPLFGEPSKSDVDDTMFDKSIYGLICLRLCHRTIYFDTLTDERSK